MFDVVVIGGGPGGYVAAIRSSQLGLRTALIEKDSLGGVCLNWGCIPTKALLKSADVFRAAKHAQEYGITGINSSKLSFDIQLAIKRSRSVASTLSKGVSALMKKNNIEIIQGEAIFDKDGKITVKGKQVATKNIIIATGARPKILPGYEPDGDRVWNHKDAMTRPQQPRSLVVVGSGAIGIEFASFYNEIGTKVTLIEAANRILLTEDLEIANMAHKELERQKIEILTNTTLEKLHKEKNEIVLHCTVNGVKGSMRADAILMAVGTTPNTDNIGLENAKIDIDARKRIKIDKFCKTNTQNIYAIGDVAATAPCLAHKASHEGIVAAEHIATTLGKYSLEKIHSLDKNNVPSCIYSHPQIASIGINEEQASQQSINYKVGKFPLLANGKSVASGDTFGMVKTIFDAKSGEILGAHMIGPEVTELISTIAIAKQAELVEEDLINTVFPHPTVSESVHEAVLTAFEKGIHF